MIDFSPLAKPVTTVSSLPQYGAPQASPANQTISALPVTAADGATQTEQQQVEDKVKQWVAQTFFGTLMKQMRDSPFKDETFSGGRGGQAYGNLYDQQIVQRMAVGAGGKLVDSITRRILASKAEAGRAYDKNNKENRSEARASRRPVDRLQQQAGPLAPAAKPADDKSKSFKELPRVPVGLRA